MAEFSGSWGFCKFGVLQRGMGSRRCCAEVAPGVGSERNPISPAAEVLLSAVSLSHFIPRMMSPEKSSFPPENQTERPSYRCEWGVWKGYQKDVNKGRKKNSAFTQSFSKTCGSFIQGFSTVDLMVSSYLKRDFMIHIGKCLFWVNWLSMK